MVKINPSLQSSADALKARRAKGTPKSGRLWKVDQKKKKFSTVTQAKPLPTSAYAKSKAQREALKAVKAKEKAMKDEEARKKQELRDRIKQRKQQREENIKKTVIGQVITDTTKIKKMNKKQLRRIIKV